MFDSPELSWFVLGLVLILSEFIVPGFVIIFFGLGAWITALCTLIGLSPTISIQLAIFLASTVLTLVLFRKKGQRYFKGRVTGKLSENQSIDDIRGERATVKVDIQPNEIGGKVEFHGTLWNAESDVAIPKGTTVEVLERSNLTLKVKPIQ
jgi:membrane protein implicated in regulation of membrane protease activity